MKISYINTRNAAGKVLSHDVTRIVKGLCKGAAFKKGHIIREEDIPLLLDIGKERICCLELDGDEQHEDEAGLILATAAAGEGIALEGPSEGRYDLVASRRGLLKVSVPGLLALNQLPHVVMACLHNNSPVEKGERVGGTRVIPLSVKNSLLDQAKIIGAKYSPLIKVASYHDYKMGALITGREIYSGRIEDTYAPVLKEKAQHYGLELPRIVYAPDDPCFIAAEIKEFLKQNLDIIIVTGGMSVDPDDVTPAGIKMSGARVEKYGAPVLPGAMFLLAYCGRIPIVGIPACGMYFKTTVFDLILPRLLAGEKVLSSDIANLGHGGFCRRCESCIFPDCSFGKGGI